MEQEQKMPGSLAELLASLDAQGITDYRRYAEVKKFLNFRARQKAIPISGSFELTPLCNLNCKMCYVHLTKEQMGKKKLLTVDQWKSIMSQAVDAGMMYATLTGGECLTYPGFDELYLYLQSMGVQISVLTNGVLMNEERLDFFKRNPPAIIQITLYGADDDTYEKVTGCRSFQPVYEGIKRVQESKLPLLISITPNYYLGEAGEKLIRFVAGLGIPYNLNPGLFEARQETGRHLQEYNVRLDDYVRYARVRAEQNHQEVLPACEMNLPAVGGNQDKSRKGMRCGAGRSGFAIAWDGTMHPCIGFSTIREFPLRDGFMDAWKRVNAAAESFPAPIECMDCAYESVCRTCMLEHAYSEKGHANPQVCEACKRMVAEGFIQWRNPEKKGED